ncbi:hypothetical protein AXF42_Ash003895 [Apostasia shenzhenica]|uniref:GYF domain-containing protein n=1 Tax=Apostasia shenzhenica TaxID=1088818 RepID=A0A2I0AI92_9ASPA|nr:hypothetical protein AXF42_Ash003895 [Apostasia shenzhenica]
MAEGKVDPAPVAPPKPELEAWSSKGDTSERQDEEKVRVGCFEDPKDQLTSESNIPLSPQWLYSKPAETKAGVSVALGDTRQPNSTLPHGLSNDAVQKDSWRLDGAQEKREWRRNVPDIESSRRWRDEERETGLLGRRERRKEGDRENEYRKNDRRPENISTREPNESRNLPSSERWHEVIGRSSTLETRRDSKWSSRWGPEDKEKDSRTDRKLDFDKDDLFAEKQPFFGNNRPSETESRDKWRPRHRQELHSGGSSSAYRVAPGFGPDKGRVDGSHVGFAFGRGRGSLLGGLSSPMVSSVGTLGARPQDDDENWHGKGVLSVNTFRYPRGKLLDLYRNHTTDLDSLSGVVVAASPLTISDAVRPLAFVLPNMEEETILEDISKGKIAGGELSYARCKEWNSRIAVSETGEHIPVLFPKMCMHAYIVIPCYSEVSDVRSMANAAVDSSSMPSESSLLNPVVSSAVFSHDASLLPDHFLEGVDVIANTSFDVGKHGNVAWKSAEHSVQGQTEPEHFVEKNLVHSSEFLEYSSGDSKLERKMPFVPLDVGSGLPDDSHSLLDIAFTDVFPSNMNYNRATGKVQYLERTYPPEEMSLLYRDPQGDIQGPFLGVDVISWYEQGFFGTDLPVCLSDAPEGTPFRPLGELMPNLKFTSNSVAEVYSNDLSGPVESMDTASVSFKVDDSVASSFGGSLDINDQRSKTPISKAQLDHENQANVMDLKGGIQFSDLETSTGFSVHGGQSLHDLAGQDAEEVLYTGRHVNSIENPLEKLAALHDLSRSSSGHCFRANEITSGGISDHRHPSSDEVSPFSLLQSDLEGSNVRSPLSSNLIGIHNQPHSINAAGLVDYVHNEQGQFNMMGNNPNARNAWPDAFFSRVSANVPRDPPDATSFPYFDAKSNRLGMEEQLYQQCHQQNLQQYLPSPRQSTHLAAPSAEQVNAFAHHQAHNQSIYDFEHLMKIELQEQHRRRQLLEQRQLQQQQHQLLRQIRLLEQQQQQEQQKKILFEHLRRQQHEARLAASHRGNTSLDEIILAQRLLRGVEQHPHQLLQHQDPLIEQILQEKYRHDQQNHISDILSHPNHRSNLSMEEQILLSLQQEQLQGQHLALPSWQQSCIEEERHASDVWPMDDSAQFFRIANTPDQRHGNIHNLLQEPLSFEQTELGRNLILQDMMQQRSFDRGILLSHSPPGVNVDALDDLSQLQVETMAEISDHSHPSIRRRQLPTVPNTSQHGISDRFSVPHLNSLNSHLAELDGKTPNSFIETQMKHLHLEIDRHNSDIREIKGVQHSKFLHNSVASMENRDSTWPFTHTSDNSFDLASDSPSIVASSNDGSHYSKLLQAQQEQLPKPNMERHVNSFDAIGRLALHSGTYSSIEQNQLVPEPYGIEREQDAVSMGHASSGDRLDVLDLKDAKTSMSRSFVGNTSSSNFGSISYHTEVKANAPVRHASLGSNVGVDLYNYEMGMGVPYYSEGMASNSSLGIHERGTNSSLLNTQDPFILSSQVSLAEDLVLAPTIKGKSPATFLSPEESGREAGGNHSPIVVPRPPSSGVAGDARFRRTSSSADVDATDASFIDIIKSTRKPAAAEAEPHSSSHDSSESGNGAKGVKRKGKKGRQIDPSLLGFKVHSNRILMGEIQRPDD